MGIRLYPKGKNRMALASGFNSRVLEFDLFPQLKESVPDGSRTRPPRSLHAIISCQLSPVCPLF